MDGRGPMIISTEDLWLIIIAIAMGTMARLLVLKVDYKQYPSYPNGVLIHVVLAFVAASIGAVAIPAIKSNNYTAVTFLALAVQNFRDVRKTERESLKDLEETEYTPRGNAYIDGIAKTFEARNYFALVVSLSSAASMEIVAALHIGIMFQVVAGVLAGYIVYQVISRFSKGKSVGDVAAVRLAEIKVEGCEVSVEGTFVTNLAGTQNAQKMIAKEGVAVIIEPNQKHSAIALHNFGQRKAILFEATRTLGAKRYNFTRKDYETGRIIILFVPIVRDLEKLIDVVKNTPLLESVKKSHAVLRSKAVED
ncbi:MULTISPECIES: YIEGIA domain-containing protein [Pelosinus]|uniref:YIEGIA protein n=1 Tax=Pelosinus fermentans B4 TaxID=1149862 RepID=I9B5G0_9FIRM|nr:MULTISPECIES: YIEGIA domain-containing protein [Pelosinus]EIW20342.1 hypothetical protein FB4_2306 [Pelosinus fermentans B4]EIW25599.1 hypothetical protein FA11_2221 [Pelosinus fermentans A11]OAM93321.1 YIEGIA protein [Pelosinus fermentans DSM 17108]SDQ73871.1 hypothetical protein SAMN04515679_1403 [Pelosinus fermentans]